LILPTYETILVGRGANELDEGGVELIEHISAWSEIMRGTNRDKERWRGISHES